MSENDKNEEPGGSPGGLAGKLLGAVGKAGGAVGNVAGMLISTAGHAADTAGRRAALTFASRAGGKEIPERNCRQLADSLAAWLKEPSLAIEALDGEGLSLSWGQAGLLKKTYQVLFSPGPDEAILRRLDGSDKRTALVLLDWSPDVFELPAERGVFLWSQGVRLGPRSAVSDYVSRWIQSELGFVFEARELIEGSLSKPGKGLFVGRERDMATLRQMLLDVSPDRRWIAAITAYSGTGKSYFLRRFEKLYGTRILYAHVDHHNVEVAGNAVTGLTSLIESLALQFNRGGCPTPRFDKVNLQFSKVSKTGPENESRLGSYLKKALQAAGSLNPVLGIAQAGLTFYDSCSEDLKQEGEALASNTWVRRLTQALVEDLQPFVERQRQVYLLWRRPVLTFDTYEWLAVVVDTWLRTCLLGNPDFLELQPLILLGGRHELSRRDTRWSEFQDAVCPIRLEPFGEAEARQYLEALKVPPDQIGPYMELAGGLPLFLSLIANSPSVESAVKALTERVLEEVESAWRDRFLEASVLDGFNRDSLAVLLGSDVDVGPIFERLTRATFIEVRQGRWHYAPEIRKIMRRTLELESPERARQLQQRAATLD